MMQAFMIDKHIMEKKAFLLNFLLAYNLPTSIHYIYIYIKKSYKKERKRKHDGMLIVFTKCMFIILIVLFIFCL